MSNLLSDAMLALSASTAASMVVNATIAIGLALIGARVAQKSRAAVRHVVLAAAFAVLLFLPVASFVAPSIRVALPIAAPGASVDPSPTALTEDTGTPSTLSIAADTRPVAGRSRALPVATLLFAAWAMGTLAFLTPVLAGLWQVRALRRSALPWRDGQSVLTPLARAAGISRRVDVVLHEATPGPMTCGIVHPAIVLPMDAASWPHEQLTRAIVHELEHIRRADWITHGVARTVCACYWFHPLVWMAWRQLSLEAERACDDAVLGASEATAYADQLVDLATRLCTRTRPQLAMADRRDLAERVTAVLDPRQRRGRAGAVWIGAAMVATIVLPAALSSVRLVAATPAAQAQTQTPAVRQTYDAATIKPCEAEENPTGARGTAGGTNATFSPGHFFVPCVTTGQLIYLAYAAYGVATEQHLINDDSGEAANEIKVRGGPSWVHSLRDKYSIEATAEGATERTVLMGAMLQSLLEDRFHLKIHRDTEEVDMLELTVGKGGFKLQPMQPGDCVAYDPSMTREALAAKPPCGSLNMGQSETGLTVWKFGSGTIRGLAGQLGRTLKTHIIDRTNIPDEFVFTFQFRRDADVFETASNVAQALDEQLGLKLTKAKGPRGFLVIDSIARPTSDGRSGFTRPARATGPGSGR